jgi:acyl-CoA thioesterase-1
LRFEFALPATVIVAALLGVSPLQAETPTCNVRLEVTRLANPLTNVAHKIMAGQPVKIVAIGSSSTAGAGASSPERNYPNRLQAELSERFPRIQFTVVNRGVNGEEINEMLRRFDAGVISEKPDLVLWQLGTNAVLRDQAMTSHAASIHDGIAQIKQTGADIILIDPQFAPKVIAKPDALAMVKLIGVSAKSDNVDLFQRYELMRQWREVEQLPFESFVSPDGLHMNDWSYGCLAKSMAAAIGEAATRPVLAATAAVPHPF